MAGLEFEDEGGAGMGGGSILYSRLQKSARVPKMVDFLVKHGIAKNDKQAKTILLIVVAVALIASFIIFSWAITPPKIVSL